MRVLLGLSALATLASVQAQGQTLTISTPNGSAAPVLAQNVPTGSGGWASFFIYANGVNSVASQVNVQQTLNNQPVQGANFINTNNFIQGAGINWLVQVPQTTNSLLFQVTTNQYAAQLQYYFAGITGGNYICDPCTAGNYQAPVGSTTSCNTGYGPDHNLDGTAVTIKNAQGFYIGFPCASFTRMYTYAGLVGSTSGQYLNGFKLQVFDNNNTPSPDTNSYSFLIMKIITVIVGDPQIVGMQGQDFQVHGMPDEIFNIVTYPTIQVNARFTYLESADCHDNYTACFAHPGTYISEQGFRIGKDKIRVTAGSFKKGLTVTVNGKKAKSNIDLKSGAVEIVNHRRVVVHTDIMRFTVTNSDKFMNQEIDLKDDKLVALGAERRQLKDNERFHPEVPLHGLQGQTWRNVEYASGLDYEGSIMDYHVVDGNLFGTDFVFNQFQA